ncbi:hypothetical protein D5S17_17015 [Pseudonocardiaceae bacterium YIM PH 21723]|nr:hypothetical protein D5S17_17015 [Pseudonocardiaceae bacterium YIM PH 21723]
MLAVSTAGTAAAEGNSAPEFTAPASAAAGGTGYAPPGGGWGPVSRSNTAIFGSPGWTVVYAYTSQSGASPIHASAKHFTNKTGTNPGPAKWSEFGFGTSGRSGQLVWGNAAANPEIKFKSLNVLGAIVDWQH